MVLNILCFQIFKKFIEEVVIIAFEEKEVTLKGIRVIRRERERYFKMIKETGK